ncbi:MAG: PPOX class F420-dependent oxidoreductase [Chloroflexi bacterium]|nr:PPOX class F420-dependent oxidoreductase [Chloroflexota bacterium]
MAQKMTPDEVRAFLTAGTRTGKLATTNEDGSPHVVPIWFVLDGDDLIFTTGAESVKGRSLRRDGRAALCVDDEQPPYAFVQVTGTVTLSDDLDEMLRWSTAIGGRYMGDALAEQFGRRNAVSGELLVRLRPARITAFADIAG